MTFIITWVYVHKQFAEGRKTRALTAALELLAEYSSQRMTEAMRGLFELKDEYHEGFVQQYVNLLNKRDKKGYELDDYRRYTYRYFQKVHLLSERGLSDPEVISLFLHNNEQCFRFLNNV